MLPGYEFQNATRIGGGRAHGLGLVVGPPKQTVANAKLQYRGF
jgi:hypothetical protein